MVQMPGPCSDRAMTSRVEPYHLSRHLFPRAVCIRNITATTCDLSKDRDEVESG